MIGLRASETYLNFFALRAMRKFQSGQENDAITHIHDTSLLKEASHARILLCSWIQQQFHVEEKTIAQIHTGESLPLASGLRSAILIVAAPV